MLQCATFVGTVTYMSPERIRNENYSYAADIWSLGLTILECATGKFPYNVNAGPANLMLQVIGYSDFFCSCLLSFIMYVGVRNHPLYRLMQNAANFWIR